MSKTAQQPDPTTIQIRQIFQKLNFLDGEARQRAETELWNLDSQGIAAFKQIIVADYANARRQNKLLIFAGGGTIFALVFMIFTGGAGDFITFVKSSWWLLLGGLATGFGVWSQVPKRGPLLGTFEDKRAVPILTDLLATPDVQVRSASSISLARLLPGLSDDELSALTADQRSNISRQTTDPKAGPEFTAAAKSALDRLSAGK